jgi:hypothetical protein
MALISNTGILTITSTSSLPSWYPAAGVSTTIPTSSTTPLSVALAAGSASYPATTQLTQDWCGGVIVYISGQPYLVVEGGGHNTSSWNGVVKLGPLSGTGSSTPTWSIFLAASPVGAVTRNTSAYTDGKQSASHTYNSLAAAPSGSVYYSTQTAPYGDGGFTSGVFVKSPSGQTQLANTISSALGQAAGYYGGRIFSIGGGDNFDRLRIYTISTNTWSSESAANISLLNFDVSMAIDTARGAALVCNSSQAVYWSGLAGTPSRATGKTAPGGWHGSLEYDADRDVFVSYQNASLTVRECSASSLAAGGAPSWTTRTFTGTTPAAGEPVGTYGRFRYVPELHGYIVLPTQSTSTYFLRAT